jgi:murein DD-endopeptidase MepM/ murein hydrolase activator NlpD
MSSQTRWKLVAVLVIASALLGAVGWQQLGTKPMSPTTMTITPYVTTVSGTETAAKSVSTLKLFGQVCFDYNGNGRQDAGEPAVPDVTIALDGANITATNATGWYSISSVTQGSHKLRLFPPTGFRYMCDSDTEYRSAKDSYTLQVGNDTRKDIGLMEGFLTSPFRLYRSRLESYVDIDPGPGVRDWSGGTRTYNGHTGTDFLAPVGTEVLAIAPGRIVAAANGWPNNPRWSGISYYQNGNFIIIDYGNGLFVAYHHLDSIAVDETSWMTNGPRVKRGQIIGYSGATGTSVPHLHLQIWNGTGFLYGRVDALDPFRDIYYGQHGYSPW